MKLKIAIVYGSVREKRQGIKAAKFIVNKIKERKHEAKLIDPLEYKLPLLEKMYKSYDKGKAPKQLEELAKIFKESDAIVVVSAEYNHFPPPALTNLLDHFLEEYFFKPSAIVSYSAGPWGGTRATVHLRDFLAELGMPAIPTAFHITKVRDSFTPEGKAQDEAYERRIKKFLDELEWYAEALKAQRKKGLPY